MEAEAKKETCTFIKPRKAKGNLRKKDSDYSVVEDTADSQVVKKQKVGPSGPIGGSTKNKDATKDDLTYKSTETAAPFGDFDQKATAVVETETERERDALGIRERAKKDGETILSGEDAERAESSFKVYKGMAGYKEWIDRKEESGLSKGAGIKAGPVRGALHIRMSARFDYQPDVCKDYKETGYCGFGDSCKFLHDRTDYKAGWEIEKEWEEQQKQRKGKKEENFEVQKDDGIPFACAICRNAFVNPVVTRCKHYFCETCALDHFKKTMKCFICGENTYGSFSVVPKDVKEKMQKKWQEALERGENLDAQDHEEQPEEQAE